MSEWQPAVVLPEDKMCELHKKLYASLAPEHKAERELRVGRRIMVRRLGGRVYGDDHQFIPNGDCVPLEARDEDAYAGIFSCEVSLD